MVVQGTDEKWMSCREWAPADQMHRAVLEISTVPYVPYYRYILYRYMYTGTSIGIQCDYRCVWGINCVRQVTSRTLPTPLPADLTTLPLQLGRTSRPW